MLTFILIAAVVTLGVLYVTALEFIPGDGNQERRHDRSIRDVEYTEEGHVIESPQLEKPQRDDSAPTS
jgi:hypothetical protein